MRKIIISALLLAGAAAYSQSATPADLPLPLYWLNIGELRNLEARAQEGELWQARIIDIPPALQPYARLGAVAWSERFGVAADRLVAFASHRGKDMAVQESVWIFADAQSARAAFAHLDHEGFASLPDGEKALGTPGETDLVAMDDFWRPAGEPVIFTLQGNQLRQRSVPGATQAPTGDGAWLDGLQTLLPDGSKPLQATFFSAEQGMKQGLPGMDKMSMEAVLEDGLPPYRGGVFVDVQHGDKASFLLAFAYDDCTQAQVAQGLLPQRWAAWQASWDEKHRVQPGGEVDAAQIKLEGGCLAVLRHASDNLRVEEHPALKQVWHAFSLRDFSVTRMRAMRDGKSMSR